jgi:hypothetical protein
LMFMAVAFAEWRRDRLAPMYHERGRRQHEAFAELAVGP